MARHNSPRCRLNLDDVFRRRRGLLRLPQPIRDLLLSRADGVGKRQLAADNRYRALETGIAHNPVYADLSVLFNKKICLFTGTIFLVAKGDGEGAGD